MKHNSFSYYEIDVIRQMIMMMMMMMMMMMIMIMMMMMMKKIMMIMIWSHSPNHEINQRLSAPISMTRSST